MEMGWHAKASHKGWKMGTSGCKLMYVTIKTKKQLANHKILASPREMNLRLAFLALLLRVVLVKQIGLLETAFVSASCENTTITTVAGREREHLLPRGSNSLLTFFYNTLQKMFFFKIKN
jgi:hypothetical protein